MAGGRCCITTPSCSMGTTPKMSRGMTLTGERTAMCGTAPRSTRSMACSHAELPKPTTRTGRPFHRSPLRYPLEWMTQNVERLHPGPGRAHRPIVCSGRDHHRGRAPLTCPGRGDPLIAVAPLQPGHRLPEPRFELVVAAVALEVLHDLVACGVARPGRWHVEPGQGGRRLRRVQVQPVVLAPPGLPHNVAGLEDHEPLTGRFEARRGRQACSPMPR